MRSFAAIATFAALAFSAVTSALPLGGGPTDVVPIKTGDIKLPIDIDTMRGGLGRYCDHADDHDLHIDGVPHLPVDRHDAPKGIADVLVDVNVKIIDLVKDLTVKIDAKVEAEVVLELALKVFAEIKAILDDAVIDLKLVCTGDLTHILNLGGKGIEVKVLADIIAQLLNVVLLIVGLVVKLCIDLDLTVLLKLVGEIVADLVVILGLVLKVVVGLVAELKVLLGAIIDIRVDLKLLGLIDIFVNVLGIKIGVSI